jgi:hypothetical protein
MVVMTRLIVVIDVEAETSLKSTIGWPAISLSEANNPAPAAVEARGA